MTEEIKESIKELEILITALDGTERGEEHNAYTVKCIKNVIDCITNLQQDLDKTNDIIKKDRQFYKCRMDEYAELQQENERLTRSVVSYDETLLKRNNEYEDYKSRCEKALKKLKEIRQSTFTKYNSNEWDNCLSYNDDIKPLENILNGSDENE